METILKTTLLIHIATGMIALLAGILAIIFKKGDKNHRMSGKIYFWCIMAVSVTALVLSVSKQITFLTLIAIFSFYLSYSGYRVLYLKKKPAGITDWIMAIILALNGLYMTGTGSYALIQGTGTLNPVLILFGTACLGISFTDIKRFTRKIPRVKNEWLYKHMGMMLGSYIATFTAFMVVNVQTNPAWAAWLLPTIIGSPLITVWIRYYKNRPVPQVLS